MRKLVSLLIAFSLSFALRAETKVVAQSESKTVNAPAKEIVIKPHNYIVMNQPFDGESTAKLQADLQEVMPQNPAFEPIYLIMNSPGGEVHSGLQAVDNLKASGRQIDTITLFSASMAFQTVQGLGQRYVTPSGILMSHHMKGGVEGEMGGKSPGQAQKRMDFWTSVSDRLDNIVVARSNGKLTLASYQDLYDHEFWCEGQTCVDKGFADAVVAARCDDSMRGTKNEVLNAVFMGMPISIELTKAVCPLITGILSYKVSVGGKDLFGNLNYYDAKPVTVTPELWAFIQSVVTSTSPDREFQAVMTGTPTVTRPIIDSLKTAPVQTVVPAAVPAKVETKK